MIIVDNLVKQFRIPLQKQGKFSTIRNLFSNDYYVKKAVDGISFTINEGEKVGFIGRNGAGKSTTIKILSGILQPTEGTVLVNGLCPFKQRIENAKQIGVVFGQKSQLWWDIPLIESYRLLREIYSIEEHVYQRNLNYYVDMLELGEVLSKPVRQMSLGQRVKADILAALLHNPKILFLDEPTIGVDIVSKKKLYDFVSKINRETGTTFILTTHDMEDIEKLCSRVIIIDNGKSIYDGSIEDMIRNFGLPRVLMIEFVQTVDDFFIPNTTLVKSEKGKKWYLFDRYKITPTEIINIASKQCTIYDLQIIESEVEDVVRSLYEKNEK